MAEITDSIDSTDSADYGGGGGGAIVPCGAIPCRPRARHLFVGLDLDVGLFESPPAKGPAEVQPEEQPEESRVQREEGRGVRRRRCQRDDFQEEEEDRYVVEALVQ
eukprot:SAG11_NODE_6928_length_1226_cov_4.921708_1_plen_106_part_00